jgi:proton-dependent oligopeptide transporter, POT family
MSQNSPATPVVSGKTFLGHPYGLSTLFFTELWERFSYYGMRGILVLFMTAAVVDGGFGLTTSTAAAIYGLYTASVYLLALPGGWIADRIMGQRNAVFTGGCIIAAGHFSMALPVAPSFYVGLVLIVLGTGLLKPNVSAIVGGLYPDADDSEHDPQARREMGARRDAGFSVFYMGINLGAFMGPLICGYLGENVNWHLGFSAAGVGMVFGLIQYKRGQHHLGDAGLLPDQTLQERSTAIRKLITASVAVVAAIATVAYLMWSGTLDLTPEGLVDLLGYGIAGLGIVYFFGVLLFAKLTTAERKRVGVIFMMFLGAALFWGGFEQAGSSMNIFAKELTDRTIFGWEAPASWLQSVNPIFLILLAPVFGTLWVALRSRNPSLPVKFGFGLLLLGAGFIVMKWAALQAVGDHVVNLVEGEVVLVGSGGQAPNLISPMWLVAVYFLHTCGELCLSPIGLSSVTKLSPKRLVSQMMGTWFLGAALGNLVASKAGGQIESLPMSDIFQVVAIAAGVGAAVFFVLSPILKKMLGGVE